MDTPTNLEIVTDRTAKRRIECNSCRSKTWHSTVVLARELDEDDTMRNLHEYEIVQCDGCNDISFRQLHQLGTPGEDPDIDDEELFPARRDRKARRKLAGARALPDRVASVYAEAIMAMNTNLPVLAGIGIRALVESVCKQKRIKGSTLKLRIDGLAANGLLGTLEAKILHRIRFLGNRAAHETKQPSSVELSAGMDIAEHLLETVYLLPQKARKLPAR